MTNTDAESVAGKLEERAVKLPPNVEPLVKGLSGDEIDDIADSLRDAAKHGRAARLSDINRLCAHLHSTQAYNALRESAYVNNALALDLLEENARLRAALAAPSLPLEEKPHEQ